MHVLILGTFLFHPLQKSIVKLPNSALSGEHEPQWLIFLHLYFKFTVLSQIQFREVLTMMNNDNDEQSKREHA